MACFMIVIAVAFFFASSTTGVRGNSAVVQAGDNAEQFSLLCRIYNVAKNPPINYVDVQDPYEIVEEIDSINISVAEEKQFNETEPVDNSSVAQVKPITTREAAVAQATIRRITQKAHTILDEIRKVNATRDIEKVNDEFAQVIFGEGMNESHLCDGALKDVAERGSACGSPGLSSKGKSAGKNLVMDFFCLCAMRIDNNKEGIHDACGMQVGSSSRNGKHGWDTACPATSSTMWASVKKECGKRLQHYPKSTEEGHEVLRDFLKHLETGGFYRWSESNNNHISSDLKAGMLGTGVGAKENKGSDLICDGSRGKSGKTPAGICVYYGPSDWDKNIPWLVKFKAATASVESINNQTATIQRDIENLQTLLHRAEEIYETTKVISEVHNPATQANFHTASKRLTAYSAAWRQHPYAHLILLFVLL
ncbi:Variant surface glycoprotein [Trypanosoma congolense IL3000]|uniref:Variant surface glycoprotein n=1 Tax=Trypanosoma congolense (strain IL3000) TaxID=1068625 RepID=F9WCK7_TRYCI|nr:Variant surface glycoprotein [Trypanosoma congolense IL3000]